MTPPDRREWLRAARAEVGATRPGLDRLEWILGVIAMTFTEMASRTLFPWRRGGDDDPAVDRFAARFGLAVLAIPVYLILAFGLQAAGIGVLLDPIRLMPENVASFVMPVATLAAVGVAAWTNLGTALRGGSRIAGHDVALRLRLAPANLTVLVFCLAVLFAYGPFERLVLP